MPVHGSTPDEVLELFTRAGGSWWLAISTERPTRSSTTVELADVPALEVPRSAAAWALPAAEKVQHLTGVTMPEALADTTGASWCLFNDAGLTDLAVSRWFATDRAIPAGLALALAPEVLVIEFTPSVYVL